ncbi:ABC transporter arginine-binding protein 1 precursor [Legionella massiliensis]|uniref:ABC transporter arginine-binding protein 1 n=1 Tax=Legionella massiliensis TaxID=1034943 RepID=A0A078KVX2_9GAMM|nr:transporter substrate-binding domain-containing protein [Legionella massiliensis]CDZ75853.1 ABC transporter arginine-binding protein 1 precursor [Legionella massiliensis]CEE11591.1 ABC transporter arginine-binding protein 1 precursor [Legionella massiliensis]
MRLIVCFLLFLSYFSSGYADIKIGTVYFYPPFIITKNEGFDFDLLNKLCARIQVHCTFVQMDSKKLFSALNDRKIDLAIGGIEITPDREAKYSVSLPYVLSRGQFIVSQNSSLRDLTGLKGKTVGVVNDLNGKAFIDYLTSNFYNQFQLKQYSNMLDIINDLNQGALDAAFMHASTANYWLIQSDSSFKKLDKDTIIGKGIGIIALPEQSTLIKQINSQLQNMEVNGDYLNLYHTYFGEEV